MPISDEIKKELIKAQKNEITEYHVYRRIAAFLPDEKNRRIVEELAEDEKRHYQIWQEYTGEAVSPNRPQIWFYTVVSRVLGFTFGFKLMEKGEERAQVNYERIADAIPEARSVIADENVHEAKLMALLNEDSLMYAGSVVLGLNDALVELTGALAGLTFAFQDVNIIALSGLITGIAASLSMGASEYLSTKSEKTDKKPVRAAITTGITYVITVTLLIIPYFLLDNEYIALAVTMTTSVVIIALFNYYISVAKDLPFGRRFLEMAGLSLSVAGLSFLIGFLIRTYIGIDI